MENKRILITGGGGSIGSELTRQLSVKNEIYVLDINETAMFDLVEELKLKGLKVEGRIGDIRDWQTVEEVFNDFKPDIVFHASALKHVTPNEQHPEEAVKTNILGTMAVVNCAKRNNVEKFINISTDKVVNAHCVMGITKKIAENYVKEKGYISVRFGNVLGSRGSVIPIWQGQLDRNESLTITDKKMMRYFMTIPQACELVIKAAEIGQPGNVLIMDMGEPKNVYDLALEILNKSGKDLGIKEIGLRPGETLTESLMTDEELKRAVKINNFWII